MKFEELNTEQQEKAIEVYRHINVDDDWDDYLREDLQNRMAEYGFDDIKISADTSFSQGSGASFTCDNIDLIKYLTKTKQLTKYRKIKELIVERECTGKIERIDHRYNHYNTVDCNVNVSYYTDITEVQDDLVGKLQKDIIDFVRQECKDFHRQLENDYLNNISDESVKQAIIDNNYDFAVKDDDVTYL